MTLKERRAQIDKLRAPKKPGAAISLPGRKVLRGSKPAPKANVQSSAAGRRSGVAAIGPPTKLRAAPHEWFGFDVEWGNVKYDTPIGTESIHQALYRTSDNKLIKQWCDSDPDGKEDSSGRTFNWGVSDPTILTEGVEYYFKIAVSADKGTHADPLGWGCATGWSAEARGPNIAAQGRPVSLSSGETYGCVCEDTTGRTPVQGYMGDPVNTATGALNESAVDGTVPAPGVSLALRRTYASDNRTTGMLGKGWSSAYDARLIVTDSKVTYVADNGSRVVYTKDSATGSYTPRSAGVTATLSGSATDGFTLATAKKGRLTFNSEGKVTSWKDRAGVGLSFTYTDGDLSAITDAAGHTIKVTIDPTSHLLTDVDLPGSRNVTYGYTDGLLTSVKSTEGGKVLYDYESERLSSITDAANRVVMRTAYSSSGRVIEQTDAEGKTTKYTPGTLETTYQDGNGGIWTDLYHGDLLRDRIDPLGNATSFAYDAKLRLKDAADARGNHTTMTYDAQGNLKSRTEGPLTQAWTYNTNNTIKSYTDGRGATTTYEYDTNQRLKEENGPTGKQSYTYDDLGNVKTIKSPRGEVTTFHYDTKGNLESETSPSGAKTTYTYDSAGRQLTITDPRGNAEGADAAKYTTKNTYNAAGLLETVTDPAGHVTRYGYDENGNQKKITDAAGRITEYEYDNFGRATKAIMPSGQTVTHYDAVGNVESVTDPTGAKTTYTYDSANRLVSMTSPRGNVEGADPAKYTTTYGYDGNGNLTETVDPTGAKTTTEYDSLNRPTRVTDALKRVTETKYDDNGNVIEVDAPATNPAYFTYKPNDLLETVKNPLGKITRYGYDADGNRTSVTSPSGRKRSWGYDADGRLETEVDARGNEPGADPTKFTTSYKYDAAGNVKQVTNPLGNTRKFEYDELGQQRVATNENEETTRTDYDKLGRIETVTAPDGGITAYTYDAAGNIKTRVDDNKHTTTYGYDAVGRLESVTDPLIRKVTYGYDADGNRESVTNARGTISTTSHDPLGRPTKTTYSDETPDVTTVFDALGNREKVTDATGTRTFTYDAANRLKTASVLGQSKGFVYEYDGAGQLLSRTLPHGRATTFTYDDDGNRHTAKTDDKTSTYGYDAAGRLTSTELPSSSGYTETRKFDAAGRITDIASARASTTLSSWHAVLDPAGQPKRIDSQREAKAKSLYYTYDESGRLKAECTAAVKADSCPAAAPTTTYTYDKVGNRKTRTDAKNTTTYSYDDADQLLKTTAGSRTTDYGYDDDGNQTKAGARTYVYDANNRLSSMTAGGKAWGFTYDADGNRTKRTKTGVTLAWDINGNLPQLAAEYTSTGALYADYQYNPYDEIESEHRKTSGGSDAAYYYHRDLVGSITDLTTSTGATAKGYDYTSAFGTGGPGVDANQPNNNFGYAGQYKEPVGGEDAGLADALGYNMRARNYDAARGRFTGRDPYTPGQETPADSPYTYTENSPTNRYDPAGTCWWIPGSGDESCWTAELPGTEWIPLSPALDKAGSSWQDACKSGSDYAKANGRTGWTGCIDEFTGVGPIRRGLDSYQQGDIADGTFQCLGGIGQFGLFLMPGPKVPVASSQSLAAAIGNVRWGAGGGGVTLRGLPYKTPETPDLRKLVNPRGGEENCRACAVAVDSALSGAPASAMNIGRGGVERIEMFYPGRRFKGSNLSSIVEEIAKAGNGARGIVVGSRGRNGHAFNVVNVGGDVVFLDGQQGRVNNITYWRTFQLLRTR
ncbi:DUF6531 domain-containing protein [Streptomyces kanamyceticus]|uniref:DUF6531 domain-containing protein n=1 Tax=Streptomyces kanamyceticus TaxID=1967 RepID=UPI0037DD9A7F